MASTYSPNLRIELIGNGEQSNTWGTTTNTNLGTLLEQAISGLVSVDVTAGNVTLTSLNGASDQSRQMIIVATGTPGVTRTITAPAVNKVYIVYNNSNATLSFIASGGTGVSLSAGAKKLVYCDGTNFVEAIDSVAITSGSINGTTIGATTASTGAFTTLSASSTVSGTGFSTYLASPPAIGGTTAAAGKFTTLEYTGTLTGGTGVIAIGTNQIYKDASGNVGIGTSSPSTKLEVKSASSTEAKISTDNNAYAYLTLNTWALDRAQLRAEAANPGAGSGTGSGVLSFWTANNSALAERMRIDSSGNVGINCTPSTKLTVAGAITITGAFALRGSYGAGAIVSNFAAGDNALVSNTTGFENTASGVSALQSNTTGSYNTASGLSALQSNTTGSENTASGRYALYNNTTGSYNTASGGSALQANTTGSINTASGGYALYNNTTGSENTASGVAALYNNTTGIYNTASGRVALLNNTTGSYNTASGRGALYSNTTGIYNTASGLNALYSNTTGTSNTASGVEALYNNTTGVQNTASGRYALFSNTIGSFNTASGVDALYYNTTGAGNSAFNPLNSAGAYAPVFDPTTENNRFCMGSTGVTNAYIQVAWTVVSDARDKINFAPVPHGLDFVNQLQPTAYQFKEDRETDVATGIVRYGFKAQDILALEGDTPVIIDNEDLDKLRFNESSLIPVLVNAIKELTARLELLEGK